MNNSALNSFKKISAIVVALGAMTAGHASAQITLKGLIPKIKVALPKMRGSQQEASAVTPDRQSAQVSGQQNNNAGALDNDYFFTTHPPQRNALGYIVARADNENPNSEAYAKKVSRNILTKDKDEHEFLRQMVIYNANNKKSNTTFNHCDEKTVSVSVITRGTDGLPTQVLGEYNYTEDPAKRMNLLMLFDGGLPYYFSFPGENLYPRSPNEDGVLGHFKFTYAQIGQIVGLNDRDAEARRQYRTNVINPKLNDSLTTALKQAFPGPDCSACLTRTVTSTPMILQKEYVDGFGNKSYQNENFTRYTITIENKCAKNIKVVGISQAIYPGGKRFGQIWKKYSANQVIKWTRDSNNEVGGVMSSLVLGGGETSDIDLSRINKKYDVEEGGDLQYLFIVEDK